jgi:hypothetical protein
MAIKTKQELTEQFSNAGFRGITGPYILELIENLEVQGIMSGTGILPVTTSVEPITIYDTKFENGVVGDLTLGTLTVPATGAWKAQLLINLSFPVSGWINVGFRVNGTVIDKFASGQIQMAADQPQQLIAFGAGEMTAGTVVEAVILGQGNADATVSGCQFMLFR